MLSDIRSAARGLLRSPTVFISGVLCLALGIGATTAISSAISRALFQSLPFREPERLVAVHRTTPHSGPLGTWPLSGARSNFPIALDESNHRLFVGCRDPARVLLYDTSSGKQTGSLNISGDTDDLWTWRGRRYLLRAVAAADYRRHMRVRSPKWGTVALPCAAFRELVRPPCPPAHPDPR